MHCFSWIKRNLLEQCHNFIIFALLARISSGLTLPNRALADLDVRSYFNVTSTSVAFCKNDASLTCELCSKEKCNNRSLASLDFRGGLHLTSNFQIFGGLSALRISTDRTQLVAVSDEGWFLSAHLEHNTLGQPFGIISCVMAPLRGTDGSLLTETASSGDKDWTDSEAIAATNGADLLNGDIFISFERHHRIWRYPFGSAQARGNFAAAIPQTVPRFGGGIGSSLTYDNLLSVCANNGGVEAMEILADGRLIFLCEDAVPPPANFPDPLGWATVPGWVVSPGAAPATFRYRLRDLVSPVALSRLPPPPADGSWGYADGDLLVLERYIPADASSAHLYRIWGLFRLPGLTRFWSASTGNILRLRLLTLSTLTAALAAGQNPTSPGPGAAGGTTNSSNSYTSGGSTISPPAAVAAGSCILEPPLLAELSAAAHVVDNFEGLAAVPAPPQPGAAAAAAAAGVRVYMMSDNNFNPLQRTLLMAFDLRPAALARAAAAGGGCSAASDWPPGAGAGDAAADGRAAGLGVLLGVCAVVVAAGFAVRRRNSRGGRGRAPGRTVGAGMAEADELQKESAAAEGHAPPRLGETV